MDEQAALRCWECGYPCRSVALCCTECGAERSNALERWFAAVGIAALDDAGARRLVDRYRRLGIAIVVLGLLWIVSLVRMRLLPPTVEFAMRSLAPGGLVPCVVIVGLWPLFRAHWERVLASLTLAAVVARIAWLVRIEWFALPDPLAAVAPSALLVDTVGILVPAAMLVLGATAVWRFGTGLRSSLVTQSMLLAAAVIGIFDVVWAVTFVAANTDGLGPLQPTLASMLRFLVAAWALSALGVLLIGCTLVHLAGTLARRLR